MINQSIKQSDNLPADDAVVSPFLSPIEGGMGGSWNSQGENSHITDPLVLKLQLKLSNLQGFDFLPQYHIYKIYSINYLLENKLNLSTKYL